MNMYKETADLSKDMARFSANVAFYGTDKVLAKKDDRKKFSHEKIFHVSQQCVNQGQVIVLEVIYKFLNELKKDESSDASQKFDLLFGDIELLLVENAKFFAKEYDRNGRMSSTNIEDLRKRYGVDV